MKVTCVARGMAMVFALLASASSLYAQGGERPKRNQRPEVGSAAEGQQPSQEVKDRQNRDRMRGPAVEDTVIGAFQVDEELASQGARVWRNKGCDVCHGIGQGRLAGPDLEGITARRSQAWLHNWIKDPHMMAESDPMASAMIQSYNNIIMPNLSLKDDEITAVINYIARESRENQ